MRGKFGPNLFLNKSRRRLPEELPIGSLGVDFGLLNIDPAELRHELVARCTCFCRECGAEFSQSMGTFFDSGGSASVAEPVPKGLLCQGKAFLTNNERKVPSLGLLN